MASKQEPSLSSKASGLSVISFENRTKQDKQLLKRFIDFHWKLYENDEKYVPLLDYEYLGFKLLGIKGFFESDNLLFKHARMRFFLAMKGNKVVGRCNAFVNDNHNRHWNDRVGFFGQFETLDDPEVAGSLLDTASSWLKSQGMESIRGPQNLPVNDATPGVLTEGFDTRPVMYYHYNKPYYQDLLKKNGFEPIKRVRSWEVSPFRPMEDKLIRVAEKVIKRYEITIEKWNERPLDVRKKEMLDIYNDAWNDNFGFVPFTEEEFYRIIDDMQLIMDKGLFIFLYIKGEPAAFFGAVPNVSELLVPLKHCRRCELFRAINMLMRKNKCKGYRLGYLGVKRKFRRLGLDGVMLWKQKIYSQERGYEYCDMGWVLEDNVMTIRLIEMMGSVPSKIYTIFEKKIV